MRDELGLTRAPTARAIGPSAVDRPGEARLCLASPDGRRSVTVVFRVLDPETRRIYWRLGRDGSADPTLYMLERNFLRLEGGEIIGRSTTWVDVSPDLAREWLATRGISYADAAVETYVERSTLGREDARLVSLAVQAILIASSDKDPYEITEHVEDCDGDVWADYERGRLVDREELEALDCSACLFELDLWESVLEDVPDIRYGRRASEAIALEKYVEEYPAALVNLTSLEWDLVCCVRYERDRLEAQRAKQAREKADRPPSSSPRRVA